MFTKSIIILFGHDKYFKSLFNRLELIYNKENKLNKELNIDKDKNKIKDKNSKSVKNLVHKILELFR